MGIYTYIVIPVVSGQRFVQRGNMAINSSTIASSSPSRIHPAGLLSIGLGSILSSLDLFVVNLAFPSISRSFPEHPEATLSLILTIFSVCFASTLVLSGRFADRYGRRTIFSVGLALFGLSSLLCGLAPTLWILIAARAIQGVAAAMLIPTSLGLLLGAYPQEKHKQMIGFWAATGSVAAAAGPVLGGFLVQADWHLIFFINVPIVIGALICTRYLKESAPHTGPAPDIAGSVLLTSGIALLTATIAHTSEWATHKAAIFAGSMGAIVVLTVFVYHCLKSSRPLLDLSLFHSRTFTTATIGMGCFYMSFAVMLLGGTMFLTQAWHLTAAQAGLAFAAGPGTAVVASLLIGRVKATPQNLAVAGSVLYFLSGLWWFLTLSDHTDNAWLLNYLPGLIMTGLGAGIAQTGFMAGAVSGLPAHMYSTGTGLINTSRQIGAAIGVALFVALSGKAAAPESFHAAWLLMSLCGLIAALSANYLRRKISPKK